MVEFDTASAEPMGGFIVDGNLGHYIYKKIQNSARVRFGEGVAILVKLRRYGEDDNLIRLTGAEYDDPDDWAEPFSLMNPEMRMGFDFTYKVGETGMEQAPKGVDMAVYAGTNNGSLFTQEYTQTKGEPAEAMIRAPVPRELEDEVKEIASSEGKCEMMKVESGTFNERFQLSEDMTPPLDYVEPHISCEGITERESLIDTFDSVLDVVEKGVRMST